MSPRGSLSLLLACGALVACRTGERPAPAGAPTGAASAPSAQPASSLPGAPAAPSAASMRRVRPPAGDDQLPIEYPELATRAQAGERVLAPPRRWVDEAIERGFSAQPMVFYGARMLEPGPRASWVETELGAEESIPNALIIPLPRGERAMVGDVVLTAHATSAGMQRALVVAGGAPERPRVRGLDVPPERAEQPSDLVADSFRRLLAGEVGATVECEEDNKRTRWMVVSVTQDRLLGLGFAGKLAAFAREKCAPLPVVPDVEPRARVEVPVLGVFTPAEVERVDREMGRVRVRIQRGHGERELTVPFGDVAPRPH